MFGFNRNLRYPETGYNKLVDDFFTRTKMIPDLKLEKWNTNCNFYILDKYDKSPTQGKVTCIPLDFLRSMYKNNGIIYEKEEEEKEDLFKKFKTKSYTIDDLKSLTYKNINLSRFYKPYLLQADLSKTVDYAKLDNNNALEKELGSTIGLYDREVMQKPRVVYRNEWMSNNDIKEFLKKMIIPEDDIFFVDMIYIDKKKSFYETSSGFLYSHSKIQLDQFKKSGKRFLFSMILYNSHFNAIIVDRKMKKKNKTGIIYLFDSQGYDKKTISYNENLFFVDCNMSLKKQKKVYKIESSSQENYHVDILSEYFRSEYKINIVVLNKFVVQLLNSECGMFSMLFLYVNILKKPESVIKALRNYFSITLKGDLTVSQIRGLFFVTNEDLSYESYMNSLDSYSVRNRKYLEFQRLKEKMNKYIDVIYK